MSVPAYYGKTFVGYLDICGFKQMMSDKEKLKNVMNKFYSTLFSAVNEVNSQSIITKLNVVAVSDCDILFLSKGKRKDVDQEIGLSKLLKFIRYANRQFIDNDSPFMTTCSIAYGEFNYQDRKDWRHVRKNCMTGSAYVESYLDSRLEKPKIKPGQCRIIKSTLSVNFIHRLKEKKVKNDDYKMLKSAGNHYNYYWMCENPESIRFFKSRYDKAFEHLYDDVIEALQNKIIQTV